MSVSDREADENSLFTGEMPSILRYIFDKDTNSSSIYG